MAKEWRPAGRLNCRLVYTHLSRSGNNGCAFSVPKFYIVYLCLACAPAQSQSQYEQWTPHNRSHVWCLCDYIIWIVEKYTTASIVSSIAKSAEMVELLFKIIELWWQIFGCLVRLTLIYPFFVDVETLLENKESYLMIAHQFWSQPRPMCTVFIKSREKQQLL